MYTGPWKDEQVSRDAIDDFHASTVQVSNLSVTSKHFHLIGFIPPAYHRKISYARHISAVTVGWCIFTFTALYRLLCWLAPNHFHSGQKLWWIGRIGGSVAVVYWTRDGNSVLNQPTNQPTSKPTRTGTISPNYAYYGHNCLLTPVIDIISNCDSPTILTMIVVTTVQPSHIEERYGGNNNSNSS